MAKLNGVKTLDMANGEITRIAYDGEEYTKVDGDTWKGDIGLRINGDAPWARVGEFYPFISGESYADDVGHTPNINRKQWTVFRKVPAKVSPPFAEMITAKVDAVEKRVTALEKAESLTPGDRVIISGRSIFGVDLNGSFGKFIGIDDDGDYAVKVDGGIRYYFQREQLSKVTNKDAPVAESITYEGEEYSLVKRKAQPGDVVVIQKGGGSPFFDVGKTYKVSDISRYGKTEAFGNDGISYFLYNYGRTESNVLVYAPKAPPKPKSGDIVVITANTNYSRNKVGDIGKVGVSYSQNTTEVDVPGRTKGNGNNTYYDEMRLATPDEVKAYEEAVKQAEKSAIFTKIGRKPNEFRKGDVIRIIARGSHNFRVGDITEIKAFDGCGPNKIRGNSVDRPYLYEHEIELVTPVESRVDVV